jgi:hypothetical protein
MGARWKILLRSFDPKDPKSKQPGMLIMKVEDTAWDREAGIGTLADQPNATQIYCRVFDNTWRHKMNKNFGTFPGGVSQPNSSERYFVYRTQSGKNLVTRKPVMDADCSSPKKSMQEEVRRAVTYAEFACDQPIYQCKATGTRNTAYNLAVEDALGKPQVLDIDLHGWTRKAGQTILIKASDNFLVLRVCLVIRKGETILEQGEAEQSELDGLIWKYILQTPVERKPGLTLEAIAYDLPGNEGKYSIELR